MFQFPGFALKTLCIQVISTWLTRLLTSDDDNNQISGGFPHSEISGSKPIPGSPKLIAGYRVLHRLLLPRHPPNALIALDLIRKKKDPHHCSVLRGTWRPREASSVKACIIYSRLPHKEKTWLVYLTWTTPPFVPKNNRTPTRVRPTTLIISLNDVNATQRPRRPTGRESTGCFPIQSGWMVEPARRRSRQMQKPSGSVKASGASFGGA